MSLNVVAFRYDPDGPVEDLDRLNRELLMRIQERGIAIPSATVIDGRFTLRVCICNHRTTIADLEDFVRQAEAMVNELLAEAGS